MMTRFVEWMQRRWLGYDPQIIRDYHATFVGSPFGQRVLQHLLDNVYCTVYEGTDPIACVTHNARRSVIQEILENIDLAEHPQKYAVKVEISPMETPNGMAG